MLVSRAATVFVIGCALGASACSGDDADTPSADDSGIAGAGGSAGSGGQGWGGGSAGTSGGAGSEPDASAPDSSVAEACGCLLGEGPYCGQRAADEAASAGCIVPGLAKNEGALWKCENDTWSVLEDCSGACTYDASSAELDDACNLPVCECFVEVAWCGSGAGKKAADMGCRIPLLPEHDGDILYCPGGKWGVKQACSLGCVEAAEGTPDSCKSKSGYRLPYDCGTTRTCSNGNGTSTHTGKDQYAYDFAMPVGTTVRAMRAGTVLAVRNVSQPGDACYSSGSASCANYANTVEVEHSDGTVALYMHLSKGTVKKGQSVAQGDVLGKSGNSGWSTGPHLHVQVQKKCGIWWCQSVPFKFAEDSTIAKGQALESQNCP